MLVLLQCFRVHSHSRRSLCTMVNAQGVAPRIFGAITRQQGATIAATLKFLANQLSRSLKNPKSCLPICRKEFVALTNRAEYVMMQTCVAIMNVLFSV